MIVLDEFAAQVIHVPLAEHDKMVEAFLLDRLDEPLDEGHGVRRPDRRESNLDARFPERRVETGRKLAVPVVHQDLDAELFGLRLPAKRCGLLFHPSAVRVKRRWRDENSSAADVQENEHKQVSKPFGREDLLRKEAALPERGGVNLQELIPSPGPAPRPRVKTMLLQDVLDRVPRDGFDTELLQLAKDAGVAPTRFPGQFQDQFADGHGRAAPARRRGPPASFSLFSDPTPQRVGMDNGHEFRKGPVSQGLREPD